MRILHVVDSVNAEVGGPSESVPKLADALMSCCDAVTVVAHDYPGIGPARRTARAGIRLVKSSDLVSRLHGISMRFRQAVSESAEQADLVHSHGVWIYANHAARKVAVRLSKPLVVSVRGMLAPWARRHDRWKKAIAWKFFARKDLERCAVFHATSEAEAEIIRALGFRQPIAVIPNGVEIPGPGSEVSRDVLEQEFPVLRKKRWLLFLSRLHPKKGVSELIQAWRNVHALHPDWHLIIAGGDKDGYGRKYAAEIVAAGISDSLTLSGRLDGERKGCALSNAELFVLPTFSENFGIAVAEALSYGMPVITTHEAPWQEIAARECGWWIDTGVDPLTEALRLALAQEPAALEARGKRGFELVSEKYSWESAAQKMAEVYRWCLGARGAAQPECFLA